MKIIKFYLVLLIAFTAGAQVFAGLASFKQDFAKVTAIPEGQQKDDDQKLAVAAGAQTVQSDYITPVMVIMAQADTSGQLNNFYDDFNSKKKKPEDSQPAPAQTQAQPDSNTYNNYYYDSYTPDYYRYYYPYNYPYYNYNRLDDVDMYRNRRGVTYKGHAVIKGMDESDIAAPERHTWYNTSLGHQSISKDLSSVGMMLSVISAGKIDELSWGVKFDYNLYTEKQETGDHVTLPITNTGLVFGKQMGNGLVESFISYCKMEDLSGLSLKLSTDQWFHKYLFATGGIGISVINDSPLSDLNIGVGAGNSMVQLVVGYKSVSSVNTQLNGPEIRLKVIL
ncbi:MAG: hypothetical protein A3J83_08580 [Elusimicrobia bacterium RIFOXYA2_FULL_40_6]|nr:MAG: hypothetical protein A3J83_08580 [Elusimicrobia bacterium RIFOXYA2_FULL_40_6]